MAFEIGNQINRGQPRGGPRPGAGRKPDAAKAVARDFATPEKVREWLGDVEHLAKTDPSGRVRLAALQELLNRALGKPRDPCEVTMKGESLVEMMTDDELIQACLDAGLPLPPGIIRNLEAAGKPIPAAAPNRIDHDEFARIFEHFTRTGEMGKPT